MDSAMPQPVDVAAIESLARANADDHVMAEG
jgi:hypothetical protein